MWEGSSYESLTIFFAGTFSTGGRSAGGCCAEVTVIRGSTIRFDKVDGIIGVWNGTRYLVLFGLEKYAAIYNRKKSFISEESDIICAFSHNYGKIKLNIYDSLPLEK